jgi:hypothetical protein
MTLGRTVGAISAKSYKEVDPFALKGLPNPGGAIELKHKAPEVTFLGNPESTRLRDAVRDVLSGCDSH